MAKYNKVEVSQKIEKISNYKFKVYWDYWKVKNQYLILDFQPIINKFKLKNNFVLLHWQAKPKNLRRWGAFDSTTERYYPFDYNQIVIQPNINHGLLQISEQDYLTVPTAVVCYHPANLISMGDTFTLK